jgi:sugar phosphate isomerase/epimerase
LERLSLFQTLIFEECIMDIALQLYSIREEEDKSFEGALALTEKAGYRAVEFAGYYGNSPESLKKLLEKYHLAAISTHAGVERLKNAPDEEFAYAQALGYKLIVCPGVPCKTKEETIASAIFLESFAKKAAQKGIVVGYHNHSHEFEKFDGKYAMDILLETAPSVKFEPDVYWIDNAGIDPVAYIRPWVKAGRVCAIHAKEMAKDSKKNAYVGEGRIDFTAIAELCPPASYPYIIEQEEFSTDPLDGITRSLNGLKKILKM